MTIRRLFYYIFLCALACFVLRALHVDKWFDGRSMLILVQPLRVSFAFIFRLGMPTDIVNFDGQSTDGIFAFVGCIITLIFWIVSAAALLTLIDEFNKRSK